MLQEEIKFSLSFEQSANYCFLIIHQIQIHVQESDEETEIPQPIYEEASTTTEQIPVTIDTYSIATEEIPVNVEETQQPNGESSLLNEIERLSKVAIDKVNRAINSIMNRL